MIGNNILTLCPAEMYAAVQHYLNTQVLKPGHEVKVKCITANTSSSSDDFEIETERLNPESK